MKYIVEQKKLESLLDVSVWELLAENNAIVAGGAITSLFCNREINDIDVYFRSKHDLVKVLAAIYNVEDIADNVDMEAFSVHVSGLSQRTIVCTHRNQMIQFMTFKYFPEVQDIFDTFDFTVCMGAFDCKTKDFTLHPDFFKHNSQRYLKFNSGTAYPLMSLMRVDKYRDKGYDISKAELLRVLFACMDLNLTSWEDAKEHIGGMYGYDMSKAFNEDREFNLTELGEQLGTLQERGTLLYTPICESSKDFWEIAEELFYDKDEVLPEDVKIVFDDEKYLYKCTKPDWTSPCSGSYKPLTYTEGVEIEVPEGGIFFHKSHTKTYCDTGYWVECEVIGGNINNLSYDKKVVYGGKVKVVRAFKYRKDEYRTEVQEYMIKKYGYVDPERSMDKYAGIPF